MCGQTPTSSYDTPSDDNSSNTNNTPPHAPQQPTARTLSPKRTLSTNSQHTPTKKPRLTPVTTSTLPLNNPTAIWEAQCASTLLLLQPSDATGLHYSRRHRLLHTVVWGSPHNRDIDELVRGEEEGGGRHRKPVWAVPRVCMQFEGVRWKGGGREGMGKGREERGLEDWSVGPREREVDFEEDVVMDYLRVVEGA